MKILNVFGTGEKIKELSKRKIHKLLNSNVPSIGINRFPTHFRNVDYWCFCDSCMKDTLIDENEYRGQKIITNRHIANAYFTDKNKYDVECKFEPNEIQNSIGNSAFYCLWWAVQNNFDIVNLYGILDGEYRQDAQFVYMKHFYEAEESKFSLEKWNKFKKIVDSNYDNKIKINIPLR